MLPLGHAGITLGAAVLINGALSKVVPLEIPAAPGSPAGRITGWFAALGNRFDIRLLMAGSLLPDIIDKPVGQLFFRETFNNGRIFCHTLLFLILITVAALLLYHRRGRTWLLVVSSGTFAHLICDQMWLNVGTLLWPIYGVTFTEVELEGWAGNIFSALLSNPEVYIPELVGGVILVLFLWVLVRNRSLPGFMRRGKVGYI